MNHEMSYLIPYTDSQKTIAAAFRRMLRNAVTAYAAMNAGYIGPNPAPQVGVQMVPHEPETGIEEFHLGWVTVQFRNDPLTEEEKAYDYIAFPRYEEGDPCYQENMGWYDWDVKQHNGPMRLVIAETFRVVNEEVLKCLEGLPAHAVHVHNLHGLTFTIKPAGEEKNNWRAVVTLAEKILSD